MLKSNIKKSFFLFFFFLNTFSRMKKKESNGILTSNRPINKFFPYIYRKWDGMSFLNL